MIEVYHLGNCETLYGYHYFSIDDVYCAVTKNLRTTDANSINAAENIEISAFLGWLPMIESINLVCYLGNEYLEVFFKMHNRRSSVTIRSNIVNEAVQALQIAANATPKTN